MRQGFMRMLIKAGQEAVMKNKKKVAPREICDVLRVNSMLPKRAAQGSKTSSRPFNRYFEL